MTLCLNCECGDGSHLFNCTTLSKLNLENSPMAIKSFTGEYRFLSNFHPCTVHMSGLDYPSVEHAYQAAKTTDVAARIPFLTGTATEAKKRGSHLKLREDWEEVKLGIMEYLLEQKFAEGSELRERLNRTQGTKLVEGNWWHDNFWGSCDCNKKDECKRGGKNNLGKILMKIREK